MFDPGAGEEYLSKIAYASQDSADQSKILKDALIGGLREILEKQTDRQIAAQSQASHDLADRFRDSVTVGLQTPLERIAETFTQTSKGNSDAVAHLLSDVMASFSQKLQELFGGQITGISQLQQKTIQSLDSAVDKLNQMASAVETAGTRTSDAMTERLLGALGAMESHQKSMNERMGAFVEQLRTLVRDSQDETSQKLQTTLAEIGEAVRAQVAALQTHSEQFATAQAEREKGMAAHTGDIVGKLSSLTGDLMNEVRTIPTEMRNSVETMRNATSERLGAMASTLETAGTKTSEAMGERLAAAIDAMDGRQRLMNESMATFIGQFHALVGDTQTETHQKLQATLAEIGAAVGGQIAALKEQGEAAAATHLGREERISARTEDALSRLGAQVDAVFRTLATQSEQVGNAQIERERSIAKETNEMIGKLADLTESLTGEVHVVMDAVRAAIESMRSVTSDAITRMNNGAEMMFMAADEFGKAGLSISGVLEQSNGVTTNLREAAASVSTASGALQGVVADHAAARTTFAEMLSGLHGVIENAKKEASLTTDILTRIEAASQRLGQAQLDAEKYLAGVSEILATVNQEFADSLRRVLGESYHEFHGRLTTATGLLREGIQELADTLIREPEDA